MHHSISQHRNKRSAPTWRLALALVFAAALALGAAPNQQLPRALADTSTIDFETYNPGTINGQDGWSRTGAYDHVVTANTYGYATFGTKSLRISNAVTSSSFGDQTFSKSLADEAGETTATNGGVSGGTRQTFFEAQWDFASTVPGAEQPGLSVVASPDRGDGSRMSWIQMADTPSGLQVNFFDVQGTTNPANFVGPTLVAGGLSRTVPHTINISVDFYPGPSNDVVKVYVDGVLKLTGTTWENYYRYDSEALPEAGPRTVDSILFRTSGTPAPATAGNGFLIDNLTIGSGETPPQCTTICYVNGATGNDSFGGTSLADAKKTIQAAIDQVSPNGTVRVLPGTYSETASGRTVVGIGGTYDFGLFISDAKSGVTVQGVDASDQPITSFSAAAATVNTNATNNFGPSGVFVEGDNVTIAGLRIGANSAGQNKTVEVIGDNFTLKNTDIADPGGSVYINDFRYDIDTSTSHVRGYTIDGNKFGGGVQLALASGAGASGLASSRVIKNNVFDLAGNNWPGISFNGAGGVPWFTYPVGGAVIQSNSFTNGSALYIRARGDYDNSQFDWASYWISNTFDKAAVVGANPPADLRTFSYTSAPYTFNNVRRIGTLIQAEIDNAQTGDTVLVKPGTYPEALSITKNGVTLQGAGAGTDAALHTIIAGPVASNSGISLPNNNTTGVTIKNLRVQGFSNGGICSTGTGNNNFTVDNVQVVGNTAGSCLGGIFLHGPVDGVTINNVLADSNTSRGIVIWDGFKQHITITNNTVTNNNCCGIELQDGTASGVTITGNTVTGNADSGIAAIGMTAGAGPNLIANNTLTNNGRFGIEVKLPDGSGAESGDGSIVVRDNIVRRTTAIEVQRPSELRDLGGIVVIRRGWVAGYNNVDIPAGVVVKNNTVSGYQQTNASSASEGFGIVVEGRKMSVSGNTVTNNDVGIQRQAGHLPYTANTNIDGDQNDVADLYFGRGNSPVTCALIGANTLSGNTVATRDVSPACDTVGSVAFSTQPGGAPAKVSLNPQPVITVLAADNSTLTSYTGPVTIMLGTNPAGGTLSGTATVNAVNGVATFTNLSIDKPGVGYTLVATSGNLPPATSDPFTIVSGPATQLAFSTQPGGAAAKGALNPQPVVTVKDADGNSATTHSGPVTIVLGANPGGGALSGTTTVNAVNGVATFTNLSIDKPGAGYTLVASATGLSGSTSAAFAITAAEPPHFLLYLPAIRK